LACPLKRDPLHSDDATSPTYFPKTDIVLQETLQDDTVNIEGGGMDQTLEANEDGF